MPPLPARGLLQIFGLFWEGVAARYYPSPEDPGLEWMDDEALHRLLKHGFAPRFGGVPSRR